MSTDPIIAVAPLGFPWPTKDPFLVCVHHVDLYPRGNERLGPAASLAGRDIGQDFAGKDGWRMYHGDVVPGFPQHPHRGFETVTVMRDGYIDHSDSLGATARFGKGDVQWLTAGAGIVHCEMFPLLDPHGPNPRELFQIWLNLPAQRRWPIRISRCSGARRSRGSARRDANGRRTDVHVIRGRARRPAAAGAAAGFLGVGADSRRCDLVDHAGARRRLDVARRARSPHGAHAVFLRGPHAADREPQRSRSTAPSKSAPTSRCGSRQATSRSRSCCCKAARSASRSRSTGPFVMNTRAELEQAFADYRRTQFGGWPYPSAGPVFARQQGRFAKHADGRVEEAPT